MPFDPFDPNTPAPYLPADMGPHPYARVRCDYPRCTASVNLYHGHDTTEGWERARDSLGSPLPEGPDGCPKHASLVRAFHNQHSAWKQVRSNLEKDFEARRKRWLRLKYPEPQWSTWAKYFEEHVP